MANIDIAALSPNDWPEVENESWEFKSSQDKNIFEKLPKYVSGFANSGGGCLLWGVDRDNGNPDGGVLPYHGRQTVRDWLDHAVSAVQPNPDYEISVLGDNCSRGYLESGNVIVAVSVKASSSGPHQSSDNKYYVRVGAHTGPASHAIVEALWAKRQTLSPLLRFVAANTHEGIWYQRVKLVNLTNSPAINVRVTGQYTEDLNGLRTSAVEESANIVTAQTPLDCGVLIIHTRRDDLPVQLELQTHYQDLAGNDYEERFSGPANRLAVSPNETAVAIGRVAEILRDFKNGGGGFGLVGR